jgi:hypothetical protein
MAERGLTLRVIPTGEVGSAAGIYLTATDRPADVIRALVHSRADGRPCAEQRLGRVGASCPKPDRTGPRERTRIKAMQRKYAMEDGTMQRTGAMQSGTDPGNHARFVATSGDRGEQWLEVSNHLPELVARVKRLETGADIVLWEGGRVVALVLESGTVKRIR